MTSYVGRMLNHFSDAVDWRRALFGRGRGNPEKYCDPNLLLNVALDPYMRALRDCAEQGHIFFPEGDKQMIAEVPGEGRVALPFPISTLTPEQATKSDRLSLLYLPLQRAGLVNLATDRDGGVDGAVVTPNGYGKALLKKLENADYFDE